MLKCFETYFDAYFAYFACRTAPILKTREQFENLVFVIMSTRKNLHALSLELLCLLVNQLEHLFNNDGFVLQVAFIWDRSVASSRLTGDAVRCP